MAGKVRKPGYGKLAKGDQAERQQVLAKLIEEGFAIAEAARESDSLHTAVAALSLAERALKGLRDETKHVSVEVLDLLEELQQENDELTRLNHGARPAQQSAPGDTSQS